MPGRGGVRTLGEGMGAGGEGVLGTRSYLLFSAPMVTSILIKDLILSLGQFWKFRADCSQLGKLRQWFHAVV